MFGHQSHCALASKIDSFQPVWEPLESRTLLSGVWTGIDADGDLLAVTLKGPGELAVTGGQFASIDQISLTGTTAASSLKVSVRMAGNGNGQVQVGHIFTTDAGSLKAIDAPQVDIGGPTLRLFGDGYRTPVVEVLGVPTGGLRVGGTLGRLTLLSLSNGFDAQVGPAGVFSPTRVATKVTIGSVGASSSMTFAGNVSTFRAGSFGAGSGLSAASIARLQVAGQMPGNLTTQSDVRSVVVGGAIGGTWNIGGGVGSIRSSSTDSTFSAVVAGGIGSVRVDGTMALTSLSARTIVSLRAGSITGGDITLTGNTDQDRLTLFNVNVANVIQDTTFRVRGNVGNFSAGAMISSDLFAGVKPTVTTMESAVFPNDGVVFGDYFDGVFTIRRVTITGPRDASLAPDGNFVDSDIFAYEIDRAQLSSADLDNSGTPFGLAAQIYGSVIVRQPTVEGGTVFQTIRLGGTWLPNPQDFHVQYAVAV